MSKNTNNAKVPDNASSAAQDLINDPSFMSALEFLASQQQAQQNPPMPQANNTLLNLPQNLQGMNTQQLLANSMMMPGMGAQQQQQQGLQQMMASMPSQRSTGKQKAHPMQQQQQQSSMIDPNLLLNQQALAMGLNPNVGSLPMTLDPSILRGAALQPQQQAQQPPAPTTDLNSVVMGNQGHPGMMGLPDWRMTVTQPERHQVMMRM
jgi:hypothetical protein